LHIGLFAGDCLLAGQSGIGCCQSPITFRDTKGRGRTFHRSARRLVRRGTPYGPAYDPAKRDRDKPEPERGLLGNFIGASLGAQFEAMSCDWLNLGLQDPRITGSNDPIVGANDPSTS
jgi:hypothetical protein